MNRIGMNQHPFLAINDMFQAHPFWGILFLPCLGLGGRLLLEVLKLFSKVLLEALGHDPTKSYAKATSKKLEEAAAGAHLARISPQDFIGEAEVWWRGAESEPAEPRRGASS